MNILYSVSEFIINHGYLGIFVSTMLEYACFPISSEILFPFIGYCASKGGLSIVLSLIFSTIAAIIGCSFCYALGRFGETFLRKTLFRKFPKLKLAVDNSSIWFRKKGSISVLFGRCFPLIRTYISFPAGMAKMSYIKFVSYTAVGSALWNTALISIGFFLGENWERAGLIFKSLPFKIFIVIIIIFIAYRIIKSACPNLF